MSVKNLFVASFLLINITCYSFIRTPVSLAACGISRAAAVVDRSLSPTLAELSMCGLCATVIGDMIIHPLDTIKTIQQSSGSVSIVQAAKKMYTTCGISSFYKGIFPLLICDGLSGAVKFACYEALVKFFGDTLPESARHMTNYLSASCAFIAASIILVPGEGLKTLLQQQRVLRQPQWWGALYAGYWGTLLRDLPYTAIELGLYANVKARISHRRIEAGRSLVGTEEMRQSWAAAAIAGAVAALATTPMDLLRTRMVGAASLSGAEKRPSLWNLTTSILRTEGIHAFFAGCIMRVLWLVPFTVVYLSSYDALKRTVTARKTKQRNIREGKRM